MPTDQKVPGSIPGSGVRFFYSWELFHGMYGLSDSIFPCPLSMFFPVLSSEEVPAFCLPQVSGGPPIVPVFIHLVYRNSSIDHTAFSGIKGKFKNKQEKKKEKSYSKSLSKLHQKYVL